MKSDAQRSKGSIIIHKERREMLHPAWESNKRQDGMGLPRPGSQKQWEEVAIYL